jgi:hypothetical protein
MVKLKSGFSESDIDIINVDIDRVRAVYAWMVAALVCKHENGNNSFEVEAWDINCVAEYPMELLPGRITPWKIDLKANVFPVQVNHAMTGHKLQGKTKWNLIVSLWSYSRNWPYIAISCFQLIKVSFFPSHSILWKTTHTSITWEEWWKTWKRKHLWIPMMSIIINKYKKQSKRNTALTYLSIIFSELLLGLQTKTESSLTLFPLNEHTLTFGCRQWPWLPISTRSRQRSTQHLHNTWALPCQQSN